MRFGLRSNSYKLNLLNSAMNVLPVEPALDSIFRSLFGSSTAEECAEMCGLIGEVAVLYPDIWAKVVMGLFSTIQPAVNKSDWNRFLTHMSYCRPFPKKVDQIDQIIDHCVTSIHSIDASVRQAALAALKAIATEYPGQVLSKLSFSLRIYSVNFEVLELIDARLRESDEDTLIVVLNLLVSLLSEEGAVKLELLGFVTACVSTACETAIRISSTTASRPPSPTLDSGRTILTEPELLQPLMTLYDVCLPMCWRKDLMNASALFDVVKATCALISVLPDNTCPPASLHSVQSAVLRLCVHAKSGHQLEAVIDAARLLCYSGMLLFENETVNALIPILIDVGVAIGPLSLIPHQDHIAPVQRSLQRLWECMSSRGIGFLLDRVGSAGKLSLVDKLVSINFLRQSLVRRHAVSVLDQLVACMDPLCLGAKKSAENEPYLAYSVLALIEAAARIDGYILTVPVIDFVISLVCMADDVCNDNPSVLRAHWFSTSTVTVEDTSPLTGPSTMTTRTYAQRILRAVSEQSKLDCRLVIRERLLESLGQLPTAGLDVVLESFVRCSAELGIVSGSKAIEILAWYLINGISGHLLLPKLLPLVHPALMGGCDAASLAAVCAQVSAGSFTEQVFGFLLSKRVFQQLKTAEKMTACIDLAASIVPLLPEAVGPRTVLGWLATCDQEILSLSPVITEPAGKLLAKFASSRLAEYLGILSESTALVSKSRSRLIVIIGIKKSSTEAIASIVRSSMGFALQAVTPAVLAKELMPVLKSIFLQPCVDTLSELAAKNSAANVVVGSAPITPTSPLVIATLAAIERMLSAIHTSWITDDELYSLLNSVMAMVLPLVVFRGEAGEGLSVPRVSLGALECLTSLVMTTTQITSNNFDQSLQFSVSLLVHGIVVFSTIGTCLYQDRIDAVSGLLVATLRHSFDPWMGLSKLAQLLMLAGTSSPLPILRTVTLQVYARVLEAVLATPKIRSAVATEEQAMEWLECVAICVPRQVDPVTESVGKSIFKSLIFVRGIEESSSVASVLLRPEIVVDSHLPALTHLLLQASSDGYHGSAIFALSVLKDILSARGHRVSPLDSSALVSLMFAHSEKQYALQAEILECIHTLSAIHLNSSLREIVDEVVGCASLRVNPQPNFSESQIGAITSIAKDKTVLINFVNFMTDLMINSSTRLECLVAANAMKLALTVEDSLVVAMILKSAPELLGSSLIYSAQVGLETAGPLIESVMERLSVRLENPISVTQIVNTYVTVVDVSQTVLLVQFMLPFFTCGGRRQVAERQAAIAESVVCELVLSDKLKGHPVMDSVRKSLSLAKSVHGLQALFERSAFGPVELDVVIELLSLDNLNQLEAVLSILVSACTSVARLNGDATWKQRLLSLGDKLGDILLTRINSEDVRLNTRVFIKFLQLVFAICDVASLTPDESVTQQWKSAISKHLLIEIEIRHIYFDTLGESDEVLQKCVANMRKMANVNHDYSVFTNLLIKYFDSKNAVLFSRTSPSRSPLVVEGAAMLSVDIANKHDERNKILRQLLKFVRNSKRNFLIDAAKEGVIRALGDAILAD